MDQIEFEKKVLFFEKRKIVKSMIVLEVKPDFESEMVRFLCFSSSATLHTVHTAIQTAYQLKNNWKHLFQTANGVDIGKIESNRLIVNERNIKVGQLCASVQHYFYYRYGEMFKWRVQVHEIGKYDVLPSPRLCAGKIFIKLDETISTEDQLNNYLEEHKDSKTLAYDIDTVNSIFLKGRDNIRVNQRMTKRMDEEQKKRYMLMQMTQFPEVKNSL
eukprot:TRINITY_DN2422_c0_g1_i1.p1 TRINITY_DN2422_c0_g1~~TRINITY_DN2422_c0_g1_i1.p1  ORF type:complete len:216 (+),score=31.59 TRINITY_DN2422_c0_g1_i1:314-961(+)